MRSFNKGKFTESELKKAIIELFKQEDYIYVNGDSLHKTVRRYPPD